MRQMFKILTLIIADTLVVGFTPLLALYIRLEGVTESPYYDTVLAIIPPVVAIRLGTFYLFGLYNRLWRYASINEAIAIIGAVSASSAIIFAYTYFFADGVPRSVHLLSWFFTILFIGLTRFFVRIIHYFRKQRLNTPSANVLIVGAGDAGAMIAREIIQSQYAIKKIVGFIDDSEYKNNQRLFGAKVLGTRQELAATVKKQRVDEIIIAMPSVSGSILREIIRECKATGCKVKILPSLDELIEGKATLQQVREISLEDLLRRDPVQLDMEEITQYLRNKRVLVTGAGGSIGSEICRQIAKITPQELILLGRGENSIYDIDLDLKDTFPQLRTIPIIADIRDKQRIEAIFHEFKPQVVFHAAAHKHVPLMERQPIEAVSNNIFGTRILAEAADRVGTETFIMISTDKAVNPTSVMGATKRIAELVIQDINTVSHTKFAAVRFGNVLGSRGSVIPLFKKQIAKGGPITITHPEMKRFFMTIPEACQLVLQAGALTAGGEVFVLDMGEPVKIVDLARDLIDLSGLDPEKDVQIKFIGMRPGEKLFEEILTAEEGTSATKNEKIYMANLRAVNSIMLYRGMRELKKAQCSLEVIEIFSTMLPTYQPEGYNCYNAEPSSFCEGEGKEAET